MNLHLRPMSEAPLNVPLLLKYADETYGATTLIGSSNAEAWSSIVRGFYEIADLLHVAETMAEMTPEGYEYSHYGRYFESLSSGKVSRTIYFRKLALPVEYRFEAEASKRVPTPVDFVWWGDGWMDYETWLSKCVRPYKLDQDNTVALCGRRVEVKR